MPSPSSAGVEIRRLTPGDVGRLDNVAEDAFDDLIDRSAAKILLASPGHALFVAIADGLVVGQIRGMVHHQPDRPPELYIDNLGVSPDWQRRRIGSRLLRALLAWGADHACTTVWVATEPENHVARAFYAALGLSQSETCVVLSRPMSRIPRVDP